MLKNYSLLKIYSRKKNEMIVITRWKKTSSMCTEFTFQWSQINPPIKHTVNTDVFELSVSNNRFLPTSISYTLRFQEYIYLYNDYTNHKYYYQCRGMVKNKLRKKWFYYATLRIMYRKPYQDTNNHVFFLLKMVREK